MNRVLPIQFQWHFEEIELLGIKNLRIRALPIFVAPEYQQLSIKRCPIHVLQDKFSGTYIFIQLNYLLGYKFKMYFHKSIINQINLFLN